jgi:hypothetical protein
MPPELRTLSLELDERTALLAAEALRGEADRRRRVAQKISAELAEAKRSDRADIRTGAMQVVETLADADALAAAAETLTAAWDAGRPKGSRKKAPKPSTPAAGDASPGDDDDELDDPAAPPTVNADGSTVLEHNDEPDDPENPDDAPKVNADGSTVLAHDDDPDVAAARAALAGEHPLDPALVAPPVS